MVEVAAEHKVVLHQTKRS